MTDHYNPETARERMAAALEPFLHDMLTGAARKEAVDAALAALTRTPADHADLIERLRNLYERLLSGDFYADYDGASEAVGHLRKDIEVIAAALAQPVPEAVEELARWHDKEARRYDTRSPTRQSHQETAATLRTLSRANTRLTEGVAAVREKYLLLIRAYGGSRASVVDECMSILDQHLGQQVAKEGE